MKRNHGHEKLKRCSYNTKRGIHRAGGNPFRGSYQKLGWFYDSTLDKFVEPRPLDKDGDPCNSWTFNTSTVHYDPPITKPTLTEEQNAASKCWLWDESAYQSDNNQGWFLINQSSEE